MNLYLNIILNFTLLNILSIYLNILNKNYKINNIFLL
jgi:hypothetical protein